MSFIQRFFEEKLPDFASLAATRLQEDAGETQALTRDLSILYIKTLALKADSIPSAAAIRDFLALHRHGSGEVSELEQYFSSDSGMDALMDEGAKFLDQYYGEKVPELMQLLKTQSDLGPSSSQQLVKLTAGVLSNELHRHLGKDGVSAEDLPGFLEEEAKQAVRKASPRAEALLSRFSGAGSFMAGGAVPEREPRLVHRILPWIFLALAALMLLFILNRGCATEHPENQSGDAIIREL